MEEDIKWIELWVGDNYYKTCGVRKDHKGDFKGFLCISDRGDKDWKSKACIIFKPSKRGNRKVYTCTDKDIFIGIYGIYRKKK